MYHGIIWPGESDVPPTGETGDAFINFWSPVMEDGVISFVRPQACTVRKVVHDVPYKRFIPGVNYDDEKDLLMDVDLEKNMEEE